MNEKLKEYRAIIKSLVQSRIEVKASPAADVIAAAIQARYIADIDGRLRFYSRQVLRLRK